MRPFTEIPLEEWRQVMDVNVASMFLTCRAVVPVMREQGGGKIVNISSGTPFRGVPFLLHYVTSKGAIVALTRALAKELGKDGIHVNCVAPGFTMSDGVKANPEVVEKLRDASVAARTLQRDQVPEDVAGAVVFLCTPGGRLHHRPDDGHRRRAILPLKWCASSPPVSSRSSSPTSRARRSSCTSSATTTQPRSTSIAALVRDAFGAHDGVEVDTQGDAFFVAFARASDAVAAAGAAQRRSC